MIGINILVRRTVGEGDTDYMTSLRTSNNLITFPGITSCEHKTLIVTLLGYRL